MRFGLIGWPLGHSFSEKIHRMLGNGEYRLYPLRAEELDAFLRRPDLGGLNVTIPYKQAVLPYCGSLSPAARGIGCVNVLRFTKDGIAGDNTDAEGLRFLAGRAGVSLQNRKVVILGTGGTSKTAAWCAAQAGAAQIVKISRSGPEHYGNIARHRDADVLINTTPVGMYPDNGETPVDLDVFDGLSGVLDVVYNPLRTALVLQARERGIPSGGGLPMLAMQAVAADRLFFDRKADEEAEKAAAERILQALEQELENVVLIGMPGCGKSRIGRAVAEKLGRRFVDLDQAVTQSCGRTPAQIITQDGEEAFREAETAQVNRMAKETGLVIACGGGTVLRVENVRALRQNGRLCWLRRGLSALATEDRPLSGDLQALYQRRRPFYEAAADFCVDNDGAPEAAAGQVADLFLKR